MTQDSGPRRVTSLIGLPLAETPAVHFGGILMLDKEREGLGLTQPLAIGAPKSCTTTSPAMGISESIPPHAPMQ